MATSLSLYAVALSMAVFVARRTANVTLVQFVRVGRQRIGYQSLSTMSLSVCLLTNQNHPSHDVIQHRHTLIVGTLSIIACWYLRVGNKYVRPRNTGTKMYAGESG